MKYWIDADGYLVYGVREKNEWESVAEIPQHHVELLSKILEQQTQVTLTPTEPQHGREPDNKGKDVYISGLGCVHVVPDKVKPLAQYLAEYTERELEDNVNNSWLELFEEALDAYQSTENVTIKIERV